MKGELPAGRASIRKKGFHKGLKGPWEKVRVKNRSA